MRRLRNSAVSQVVGTKPVSALHEQLLFLSSHLILHSGEFSSQVARNTTVLADGVACVKPSNFFCLSRTSSA